MFASTSSTSPACHTNAIQASVTLRMPLFKLSPLADKSVLQWTCQDCALWLHFVFDKHFGIPLGEDSDLQSKFATAKVCGKDLEANCSNLRFYFSSLVQIDDLTMIKALIREVKALEKNQWSMYKNIAHMHRIQFQCVQNISQNCHESLCILLFCTQIYNSIRITANCCAVLCR